MQNQDDKMHDEEIKEETKTSNLPDKPQEEQEMVDDEGD
jgi:hypothetical protein